jgi:hypothetical protein
MARQSTSMGLDCFVAALLAMTELSLDSISRFSS